MLNVFNIGQEIRALQKITIVCQFFTAHLLQSKAGRIHPPTLLTKFDHLEVEVEGWFDCLPPVSWEKSKITVDKWAGLPDS